MPVVRLLSLLAEFEAGLRHRTYCRGLQQQTRSVLVYTYVYACKHVDIYTYE